MTPKQIYLIKLTCIHPIYAEDVEEATTIASAKKQDFVKETICDITVFDRIDNRDKLMQDYHYLQGTRPYDYNGKMEDNCYDLLTDPKVRIVNDQLTELQKNQILLDHFTLQELQAFSQNNK